LRTITHQQVYIVVIPEGFFIVPELCCDIGQHPDVGAIVTTVFPLAAANNGGNDLIKLSVPAYQELDIFVFPQ